MSNDSGTPRTINSIDQPHDAQVLINALASENADLRRQIAAERDQLSALIMRHALATGHGDTFADLLGELDWQLTEREQRAAAERERVIELATHDIPHYAYGDNQSACEMAERLAAIRALATQQKEQSDG